MKNLSELANTNVNWGEKKMTREELIQEGFAALNNFKRHRALSDIKSLPQDRIFHELQTYKMMDRLELALRAINRDIKGNGEQ